MLKKIFLLCIVISIIAMPIPVWAEEVHIYLFYGNTCSICEKEREYLKTLEMKYENIRIFEFETYANQKNEEIMNVVKEMYHIKGKGVPFTVVGDTGIYGFSKVRLESVIKKYNREDYYDRVGVYLGMFEDEEIVVSSDFDIDTIKEKTYKKEENLSFVSLWGALLCILFVFIFILYYSFQKSRQKT